MVRTEGLAPHGLSATKSRADQIVNKGLIESKGTYVCTSRSTLHYSSLIYTPLITVWLHSAFVFFADEVKVGFFSYVVAHESVEGCVPGHLDDAFGRLRHWSDCEFRSCV
jgi:hypothetical protein